MKDKALGNSELSALCMELHLIMKAGIPLSEGLALLLEDAKEENGTLKQTLAKLHSDCEDGKTVSAAFQSAGAFPRYLLHMVEIGEATGNLDVVFRSLSVYYDRQIAISQNLRSMVLFPCILFATMVAIVVVLITYVLPIFQAVFTQLGVSLSSTAAWFVGVGELLRSGRFIFLGILVLALVFVVAVFVNPPLRARLGKLVSRVFAATKLGQEITAARFAAAMAMTISSGIDIYSSLQMAEQLAPTTEISKKSEKCRGLISDGTMFYTAVSEVKLFEPVYCRMLSVGVKTGSTDTVMEDIARRSEERANQSIESTIARVEPCLVVIMSLMVGLILLSVMVPLMGIISSIG